MIRNFFVLPALCAGYFACSVAAVAQTDPEDIRSRLLAAAAEDSEIRDYLRRTEAILSRNGKGQAMRRILALLFQVSPRGEVSIGDITRQLEQERAARRAGHISSVLSWDLDGDGALQKAERDQIIGAARVQIESLIADADSNGDEQLSFEELLAVADEAASANTSHQYSMLMVFDVDQDGTVVVSEVSDTLDVLGALPLDLGQRANRPQSQPRANCDAPKPAETDQVVVLSGYDGSALSTVTIAGPDAVTQVARLRIEEGEQPIYLFVTAHSNVIWDVSGATGRLKTMVVQARSAGNGIAGGVIGMPSEKVHFVRDQSCMLSYAPIESQEGSRALQQITGGLGRAPDLMLSFYTIGQLDLPSGTGTTGQGEGRDIIVYGDRRYQFTPDGPRAIDEAEGQLPDKYPFGASIVYTSLLRFHPDGVRTIDPDSVVSPIDPQNYDVLPQEAGLLQLVLDGRLRRERTGPFTIVAPIERFPAGLNGAHRVDFVLSQDVPMPAGSPGHSSVSSAETGECLAGFCR